MLKCLDSDVADVFILLTQLVHFVVLPVLAGGTRRRFTDKLHCKIPTSRNDNRMPEEADVWMFRLSVTSVFIVGWGTDMIARES